MYSKQRMMLQKVLLKTTETIWSQRILKTSKVPEITRSEFIGKVSKHTGKGVLAIIMSLNLSCVTKCPKTYVCLKQQPSCMLKRSQKLGQSTAGMAYPCSTWCKLELEYPVSFPHSHNWTPSQNSMKIWGLTKHQSLQQGGKGATKQKRQTTA